MHIPFCDSRCRYCDFYLETGWSEKVLEETVEAILREARLWAEKLGGPGLRTLYWGGGTPSVLPTVLAVRLARGLREIFPGTPEEFSMEANPESLSPEGVEDLAECGLDRISLGVQSLQDGLLHVLGRRARRRQVLESLEMLSQRWSGRLNLDLITGLPGQTPEHLSADLDELLAFGPGHFSLYELTLEPKTALHDLVRRREVFLPDELAAEDLWFEAAERLKSGGFRGYEVSNFALPGQESKHNLVYWRLEPYLGLGPGAHSTLPGGDGPLRWANPPLFAYLSALKLRHPDEAPALPLARPEDLSKADFFFEHFMTALRTEEGLDPEKLRRVFGIDCEEIFAGSKRHWEEEGFLRPGPIWAMRPEKRQLLNSFLIRLKAPIERYSGWPRLRIDWPAGGA